MITVTVDTRGWDALMRAALHDLRDVEAKVSNALNYVTYLEYGSSKQAPRGMFRVSLGEVRNYTARVFRSLPYESLIRGGRLQTAMGQAVDASARFAQTLIRSRTPIKTGKARLHWLVTTSTGQILPAPALSAAEASLAVSQALRPVRLA